MLFLAFDRTAALLQPALFLPSSFVRAGDGCIIRVMPSKSIGSQVVLCTRKLRCCSLRAENTMVARPFLHFSRTRFHSSSRTRALTFPTYTPRLISCNHFVRSPRKARGHFSKTMTTNSTPQRAFRCFLRRPQAVYLALYHRKLQNPQLGAYHPKETSCRRQAPPQHRGLPAIVS